MQLGALPSTEFKSRASLSFPPSLVPRPHPPLLPDEGGVVWGRAILCNASICSSLHYCGRGCTVPTWGSGRDSMEDQSPLDRVRKLLETNALPQTTEVAFSCSSGGRGLHVEAWDVRNGAVRKTYKSDCDGEGSHLCMAGADYLLCALKSKPFILVWRLDKVKLIT